MKEVVDRFLKYVQYDTTADDRSGKTPSSEGQLVFGKELCNELTKLGLKEVSVDENGYIMATLPSNVDYKTPVVGFIAHMDTSPDMTGKNVKPQIVTNYDGKDLILNKEENIILKTEDFPEIKDYIGKDLITTDGTTLLGADDKAGIAEILTAIEYLIHNSEIPHGTIKICFTPDEEIGQGADHFDVAKFGADFAYTIDGCAIGELEYENFNACGAVVTINGRNVHPGMAKNKMKNAILIANEFSSLLPENERPSNTEGYEGFFHLNSIEGTVEKTVMEFIIRDFDMTNFQNRKMLMNKLATEINAKYGEGTVCLELKDQYFNMIEKIEEVKYIVDIAKDAMKQSEVKPIIQPIRGGTDGARLSFMGLPTPNIFTGGINAHGRYEFVPIFAMEKAVQVITNIIKIISKK